MKGNACCELGEGVCVMRPLCAAVNCKYSLETEDSSGVTFVNFPEDDSAKLWAQNCGRSDLMMKSTEELHLKYYVCSHHIEDHYYISKANPIIIKQGCVPTIFGVHVEGKDSVNMFNRREEVAQDNAALAYCDINVDMDQYNNLAVRLYNVCRMCGESAVDGVEIFDGKGIELRLEDKINLHMPVFVSAKDPMPQKVCSSCCDKLEITNSLALTCLKSDMRLRRILNVEETQYDNKYSQLVKECSLQIAEEMCIDDTVQTESLSFPSDKPESGAKSQELGTNLQSLNTDDTQNSNFTRNNVCPDRTAVKIPGKLCTTNNGILCLYCKDSFKTQEIFENHKILCDEEETIDSQKQGDTYNQRNETEVTQSQLIVNTCTICQQVFNDENSFDKHKRSCHRSSGQMLCQVCNQLYTNQNDLDAHECSHIAIRENTAKCSMKRCGHCDAVYHTKKELMNHIAEFHEGRPLFGCLTCDKSYEKWSSLDVHEATHRTDKPYLCDMCGKRFKHSNNLRGHKRIHLDESRKKRHVCAICGNAFRSRFHLGEHMNKHDGNKPYSCEHCGKAFYKRIQLRQHKLSHGTNRHACPICGVTFNRRSNMSTHLKRHNDGDGSYTCSVCACRCKSMSDLKMHRKKHTEEDIAESMKDRPTWQCKVCNRMFSKHAVFANHERLHDGENLGVECDECGKHLANRKSLTYHKRSIHSNERPHMCQYCGESFVSKDARLIHERIHTGERPYVCKICNTRYRCSSNLSQHMKTHSGIKPHKCVHCSKEFARKGALNVHERIHTGVKPFPCETCGRTFSQKNDMLKHRRTHSVKSMQCDRCNQVFTKRKDILRHVALHEQNVTQEYEVPQQLQQYTLATGFESQQNNSM